MREKASFEFMPAHLHNSKNSNVLDWNQLCLFYNNKRTFSVTYYTDGRRDAL